MNAPDQVLDRLPAAVLTVGDWCVTPELNQISRAGTAVRLEPKAIELLAYLARRPGEVVSREELLDAIWPGVVVGDNALTQVVAKLRKALGDTAREPVYIEAVSKRGYRLIAPVALNAPTDAPFDATPDAPPDASPTERTPPPPTAWRTKSLIRLSPRWVGGVVAAALTVAVAAWLVQLAPRPSATSVPANAPLPKQPTVIVRPIEAIGEDSDKLMARGLTADLINDLSKVSGLSVISGGGATATAETPGSKAGASTRPASGRYALTGTLQSDGKTLRLLVGLADADTGRQIWSQRYERERRDLFAMQDDLVRTLLEQLPIRVSQAETASLAQRFTRSVPAYEHFLRAQSAVQARQRAQNDLARELYWKAIELDPGFARAYAGLAMTHALAFQLGWEEGPAALNRAMEFARTATQMNPALPEAHWVLGFVETQRRRHPEAIEHLQDALRLNPSYADAYALMGGIQTYIGQPAEGVALLRTALRLNPEAGSLYFLLLGRAYYFLGDDPQARVNLEQALARNGDNVEARAYLVAVLSRMGDHAGAAWQADEIRVIEPKFSVSRWLGTYPMTDKRQQGQLSEALGGFGL